MIDNIRVGVIKNFGQFHWVFIYQSKPRVNWKGLSGYEFDGSRFFSDMPDNSIPEWMYTMRYQYHGRFQNGGHKVIHLSDVAIDPWNHGSQGCVKPGRCFQYMVDPKDVYFHHYRRGWKVSDNENCMDRKCVKYDPSILKYKTRLEVAMKNVLVQIFQFQ